MNKLTGIKIKDYSYTDVTRERDPEDRWSGEDTDTSHDIQGFTVTKGKEYFDLEVPFKIKPNTPYYLLYCIYGTGDSFSRNEGQIEFVGLYESKKLAEKNAKAIEAQNKEYKTNYSMKDGYSVTLTANSGEKFKFHAPWNGYFECLNDIEVEPVYLLDK